MLYSETKERQSRFITALKIGFPFLILIVGYMSFFTIFDIEDNNFLLLLSVIVVYIYYVLYMIYKGFRTTLIDNYSKAFNAEGIMRELQKQIKETDKKNRYIAMVDIKNISDIKEQYGIEAKNKILEKFVKMLNSFLKEKGFTNAPIGRFKAGSFLLIFTKVKSKKNLQHILTSFKKEIENIGINKIEIQTSNSIIELSYDNNSKNIISKLINLSDEEDENEFQKNIKPDKMDELIKNAVEAKNFIFTYHRVYKFNEEKSAFLQVNARLSIDHYGILSKKHYIFSIFKNGYEIKFDQIMFLTLLEEIKDWIDVNKNSKFLVRISAVSFRNRGFLIYVKERLKEFNISPENICFSISERKMYTNFLKFKESIKEYKSLGFSVAFDEFGLNEIGIEYLKHELFFDLVLFDIDYTKNLEKKSYFELLKSLIVFCNALDVKTVVRFVDKKKMGEILKECNPDFVQGFLYEKPKYINEI